MRSVWLIPALTMIAGCAEIASPAIPVVPAVETHPVQSDEDAADDPAIWVNPADSAESRILGTDKQAGLYVYDLYGSVLQFLPVGRVNNVDLLQGVSVGYARVDVAAASNRTDDTVSVFSIREGAVKSEGGFVSASPEPYGLCMGAVADRAFVFVTHKTGELIAYRLDDFDQAIEVARLKLETQLEGCVFDRDHRTLYIGEENRGIWAGTFAGEGFGPLQLIDEVHGKTAVKADVEGLTLYESENGKGYLIASSQGNNSFAVYERGGDHAFIGRFRIVASGDIDGVEETDGIAATSAALGTRFPKGVIIVQDGRNEPSGAFQNFKVVDWRTVEKALRINR